MNQECTTSELQSDDGAAVAMASALYATPAGLAHPLRVVLVVPQRIPAWLSTFLDLASGTSCFDICVLPVGGAKLSAVSGLPLDLRAFLAFESARFGTASATLSSVPIHARDGVTIAPEIRADAEPGEFRARVNSLRPDLILSAGFGSWAMALADCAEWGCWHIDAGLTDIDHAGTALLAPMLKAECATRIELELHSPSLSPTGLVGSWGSTQRGSFHLQRERAFLKLPLLLLRALYRLAADDLQIPRRHAAELRLAPSNAPLGFAAGARALAITLYSTLRWQLKKRRRRLPWHLVLRQGREPLDPAAPHVGSSSVIQAQSGNYWADPCVVEASGRQLIFVEEMTPTRKGVIACLELLPGAVSRLGIALEEPGHLSYPQVFPWNGEWYLTVESSGMRRISLYKATAFPLAWHRITDLVTDRVCVDPTLHFHQGHWYLFATIAENNNSTWDELFLFVGDHLAGPYHPHPANPIVSDVRRARSAGRLFHHEGKLIRPAQDCASDYGSAIVFNQVLELSPSQYRERPLARLAPYWALSLVACHTYSAAGGVEVLDARGYPAAGTPRLSIVDETCALPAPATAPDTRGPQTTGVTLPDEVTADALDDVPIMLLTAKDSPIPATRQATTRAWREPVAQISVDQDRPPPAAKTGLVTPAPGALSVRRPGIGTHYLHYSVANLAVLLAGFISFPVLTRLLDNTQYGILGYFNTWMLVAIAIAKLGGQHAIVRFYPHDGDAHRLAHFSTNLVLLPMALSLSLWTVVAAVLVGLQGSGRAEFSPVFWCVVLIIPVMVVASIVQAVVRASERSGLVMTTKIVGRGMELTLILGFVILLERSAFAVYGGRLIAGTLLLGYFIFWAFRNLKFSRGVIDLPAMAGALQYGLPLMANEFAAMVLVAIDRIMLKEITGDFAIVGIYTIGYSLAMQINLFMNATLWEAFVPVANRVHGAEGDAAVRALKERVLLPMTYASLGVAAMLLAVGQDALVALSGPGKAASGSVFVVVGSVMALYPLLDVAGYGLLLRKRSMQVFVITFGAAALNVVANLVLIPKYGYMGAAWATVISYVALGITNCLRCPRGLRRFPNIRTLAIAGVFALLLLAVVKASDLFGIVEPWLRVLVGGGLFLLLYALPVWLLDPRLRAALPKKWHTTAA